MRDFPLIVLAEYFGKVFGLKYTEETLGKGNIEPCFTFSDHVGMAKSFSVSPDGSLMLSGGTDQHVRLFDTLSMRATGIVSDHTDSVLALSCPDAAHFLSGSQDGDLLLFGRVNNAWERLLSFRGHKGAILAAAVHPSRRLALSSGADGTVRVWDLIKGRQRLKLDFSDRMPDGPLFWNPDGVTFAVVRGQTITLHSIAAPEVAAPTAQLDCDSRVIDACFATEDCLVFGCEDGTLRAAFVADDGAGGVEAAEIARVPLHALRVRALGVFTTPMEGPDGELAALPRVFAASSDGGVAVVDLGALAAAADTAEMGVVDPDAVVTARFDVPGRIVRGCAVPLVDRAQLVDDAARHRRSETAAELAGRERREARREAAKPAASRPAVTTARGAARAGAAHRKGTKIEAGFEIVPSATNPKAKAGRRRYKK